jgi:hypothetical protein
MFLPVINLAKPDPIAIRRSKTRGLEIAELMAHVAPAVERLLGDGVPRSRREIFTAVVCRVFCKSLRWRVVMACW